jgi:hypothetical protein
MMVLPLMIIQRFMQKLTQASSGTKDDGNVGGRCEFEWWDDDHQPHWLRSGKGQARLHVSTHVDRKWLSFAASEINFAPTNGGSKRTMVTLDEKSAAALYAWLTDKFE